MKSAFGAAAVVIGLLASTASVFATAAIGLRTSLDNCINPDLSSPERISACNQIIHTNLFPPMTKARLVTSRGNAYFAVGNLDSALDDYTKAISLDAALRPPVVNRAVTLVRLGKCEQANLDFNAALVADSHSWRALYGRSLCKAKIGDQVGAQSDLAAATAINPNAAREFVPVEIPRWYQ